MKTIHLNMKVKENSESAENRKTDAMFFKLYDQYGATIYRNICKWVDELPLAKEILFKSFLQMHRDIAELPAEESEVLPWMMRISHAVCCQYTAELYGKRRCC